MRRFPVCLLLLLGLVAGCAAPADRDGAVRQAVAEWAAGAAGRPGGVPLESWSYEVTSVEVADGGTRATAGAELRYRLAGHDAAPAGGARELSLAAADGRWRVTADRPAAGALPELWDQGPVQVVQGRHALVLGTGPRDRLTGIAAEADRAVPAVTAAVAGLTGTGGAGATSATPAAAGTGATAGTAGTAAAGGAWATAGVAGGGATAGTGGRAWAGRVVVLVPGSVDRMAALLGSPPETYRGMAAVTTGRVGAAPAPADRVVVNPQAYQELSEEGRRIVLAHETTHVATRPATSASTPLWLSEGFADWVAYRDSGRAPRDIAPAAARAVRAGRLPAALPGNAAFTFGGDQEALSRAYEESWLACRTIAARWGEPALLRLYEAAAREPLPTALATTLGTDPAGLTSVWRSSLTTALS
ncbi:hypothetical protein DEJ50_24430 [Streptomyces venezuelae]|uniref:Lipoprotein n=1 Tax=Streptomyces venezuelae TaxID=54571 RepID=A0A5P2DB53_STRVZ|nr:hypothetical protein [Streptomyces venezuelae]QES50501.1 hypothetical protein DEJ50_24430 [Streptomyces venezuelae]